MSFLDRALQHAALGLYVFPVARDKSTLTRHGFKDASIDPAKIRTWWAMYPSANPGFSPGASDVAVLDIDHGLTDLESFIAWRDRNALPVTYTVRSGSRPEFKVHMYFKGAIPDVGKFDLDGCSGQVKSLSGYVLAAGSEALHGEKHDKPGAPYEVIDGTLGTFAATPEVVRQLRKPAVVQSNNSRVPKTRWNLPVHEGEDRTGFLLEQTGAMRNLGCGKDAIFARMVELNEDPEIIADPLDCDRLESTAANCAKYPVPGPAPLAVIGSKTAETPKDWRTRYVTFEQVRDAKPTSFLIEGFLALDSITALAAPVGQRKSLIALNVAHALCTGEPLFDYFKVSRQPERVIYLCPEMGLSSFSTRLKSIGLLGYVGKTLFCQTMDDESVSLSELGEELPGSVVIIDTLTRFVEGDQNSSEHMSKFAKEVFRLKRAGATVLLLHHSVKGTGNSAALTLDSAMRGSTELAAFVTSCWATRLTDPDQPYASPSLLANVKQRDFESKPFEATSDKRCRMHIVGEPGRIAETKSAADAEAKAALGAILKESPGMGINKLQEALRAAGHKKGVKWVTKERAAIVGKGVTLTG